MQHEYSTVLSQDHLKKLHEGRSIALALIQQRAYQSLPQPEDLIDRGFSKAQAKAAPALGIPLWNVHGQRCGWQMRPDSPRQFSNGNIGKYELPKGDHLILDVHPSVQPLIGDPSTPLWITEGIPKGDSLASRGVCAIALQGVGGYRGTNAHGGRVVLSDWESVALNGREVIVVYDSDIYTKPQVERDLKGLYKLLRAKGARPRLVQWPEEYRQTKIGVDDFFAKGGTLDELLAMVPPMGPLPQSPVSRNGSRPGLPPQAPDAPTSITTAGEDYPYSDAYNALALVRAHGHEMRYCSPWKTWLTWTGSHWQRDSTSLVLRWQRQTVQAMGAHLSGLDEMASNALLAHIKSSLNTSRLKAAVEQAQSWEGISTPPEAFDTGPWLLNVANGTLDLRTGTLRAHACTDFLTFALPVAYDATASCPTWDAFLARIMAGNQNLLAFLQRAIGYALTGVIREHVLLILWGRGRNGKSTFLNLLRVLLGAYAMKAPSELLMVSHNDRHPTERADLYGKRFVSAIETEQGRRLAEVFVKEATGGDPIRARRMREDFWEFQPTHKVFLATNHKPTISGTDTAIWERIRLVPFAVTIPEGERDTTLPEKLEQELSGILNWALQGCLAWQQDGLGTPEEVRQATAGYQGEMDVLGQFIEECCLVGPAYRTKASTLYDAYKRWCDQQGVVYDIQRTWGMSLTERGFERKRGTAGAHWWLGIGLLQPPPPEGKIDAQEVCDEKVTQVTDSDPKNGINSSLPPTRRTIPIPGSLGSLGSLGAEPTEGTEGENGIKQLRNSHVGGMPISDSVPSVPSVPSSCPGCARPTTWLLREGREVCYKCGTDKPQRPAQTSEEELYET